MRFNLCSCFKTVSKSHLLFEKSVVFIVLVLGIYTNCWCCAESTIRAKGCCVCGWNLAVVCRYM